MWTRIAIAIVLLGATPALGDVYSYECNSFPADGGWDIQQNWCSPKEWVDQGHFYQHVEFCEGYDPPERRPFGPARSSPFGPARAVRSLEGHGRLAIA